VHATAVIARRLPGVSAAAPRRVPSRAPLALWCQQALELPVLVLVPLPVRRQRRAQVPQRPAWGLDQAQAALLQGFGSDCPY